jgi:ferredoxin
MLIHSASQLLTIAGGPQRGHDLGKLNIIQDGALLIEDEQIIAVGTTGELRAAYPDEPTLDAGGRVVLPGFVDPHTHLIWAGDRADEFERRLQGVSYLEILAGGGGILSTVRATRLSSIADLQEQARRDMVRKIASGLLRLAEGGDLSADLGGDVIASSGDEAAAETVAASSGEGYMAPWIDTEECTACDECVNINGAIFAYNEQKKAYIKDPRGGPYRDLVKAAEKCTAQVIHPGTPADAGEKDVEKWTARGAKYN